MSELEAAMLFLSSNREVIFEKIENVIRSSSYESAKSGTEKIHDLYYDTRDKKLEAQKIQLRVRILQERVYKVTLKVLKEIRENYSDRVEIERFWSQEAFDVIANNLVRMNIRFQGSERSYDNDPKITFNNLGLIIIQNRKTIREILNAVNKISGQIEFEFDVDTTSILLNGNNEIRFSELEIESKKSGNEKKLDKIVGEVIKFPEFMSWPHSKLETGMAIRTLFNNKLLDPKSDYDEKNELTANGIRKISDLLKDRDP
ncbi:MAG TPA: CYTH domain-containing protein [Nitrososphaeraceae archaeon]|nr:CYTH domain-containing protein [Nitrososphaeraceae archaeon]